MLNKRGINLLIVLVALVALIAGCAAPVSAPAGEAAPGEQPAAEVTIDVLTFTGPQIAEPLQRRGAEFTERTGIKVNVTVVPFSDLYQKILTDLATGTNAFDVYVFAPQWMVDYVEPGYLEPLTDRVANNAELQWEDIAPFFRDFSASYKGEIYTIPLDGDFQMVYYRTDVLEELGMEPPQTWEDYLAIAEAAHGMDMNGDGEGDYGSCISKKRAAQAYWMVSSIASAYLQSQGTAQGGFFDLDTFKPLYGDNEGFRKALEVYKATTQFGPPEELNLDVGDTRGLWTAGRCALSIDWGDIGTLAIAEGSQVNGKTGAVILPGSTQVLDRATGKLVPCDANTCPYAVDGVNHAPFAAFGGWSGAINAASDDATKDAAFNYLAYVSAPEQSNVDVTIGATGFNPYRISQFENLDLWIEAGMTEEAANLYLGAIKASLESPNMVLDLRVPQNQRYQQVVLDTAISQFLAGELTLDETVKAVEAGWEEITEELGRDTQRAAYLASLGVTR
ncbi:extracellular solute-binding protein [Caldilinea sp.]|jgi:multiple sugar transport system substrate-binding protein|uniref:ABC transporter substrate-binding protein n=1 Tax=Caldilinea sp. TaxID=2293560 RepID=UPI001B06B414|nr:extracellular solute-binding protein [Caldilinea sp.]MBO9394718.1 extracellular solute-binding protein [Caldilinea sp.]